jgi:haloacetate dehalogenase
VTTINTIDKYRRRCEGGAEMFADFNEFSFQIDGTHIRGKRSGSPDKPALLLLHGHPETHLMWHRVAPQLAEDFFVVAPDLRGYGQSGRPTPSADHSTYSKRRMALDAVALMRNLGHERFAVAGHDRGARVAARLAADAPEHVLRAMLIDIAPTLDMYEGTTRAFATSYWHWFFLIQPFPLPESLIEANPRGYVEGVMGARHAGLAPFPPEVLDQYIATFAGRMRSRGVCEDYRASATIDLDHDRSDRERGQMIEAPLRVLWAKHGVIERLFDPIPLWKRVAVDVSGRSINGGHYLPEENPDEVLAEMRSFFEISMN